MWLAPATARADTASVIAPSDPHNPQLESGWQAGTCKKEPAITDSTATDFCNATSNPGEFFFEEAAAHPNFGFTQFIVANKPGLLPGSKEPTNEIAYVRVDLPVGLAVNPGATERCPIATFEASASGCPAGSKVGESGVTASEPLVGIPIAPIPGATAVNVYNVVPKQGQAARFGLELAGNEVFLEGDIDSSGDYHEGFTIAVPHALPIQGIEGAILKNRLVFNGRAGDGTFLTTPSTCNGEYFTQSGSQYSTFLKAASYAEIGAGESFPAGAGAALESPIPPGTSPNKCNTIPYTPSLGVAPGTEETNAPAPAQVTVTVPHIQSPTGQDDSTTKEATVVLPPGMGINPSAAAAPNGLKTCENGQFVLHSTQPISCPAASRIGTATIASSALPEGNLEGAVYIGKQESTDPASGNEYRIFVDATSARYGVDVRLVGHVFANPITGQLTTHIAEIPQVPFTGFKLEFVGGAKAVLSSPPTCGPNASGAAMTPWSGNAAATPGSVFSLHAAPGGGACAATLASRPFAPSFTAAPKSSAAGAYSPLQIAIGRANGQQELKAATVALAPGMIGKLAGIPYCPASALAAATTTSGAAQTAHSSCPAKSEVGTATVQAGTGAAPLTITGKVFLSGPYHGAPLSLAVVTPATAGPFDLGTVVVRVALEVDPDTSQVTAVSDPIPHVFGGAILSIRSIALDLSRKEFTLNPTSCAKLATTATLNGGGADPGNSADWSSVSASAPFQATNCGGLDFKPSLTTKFTDKKKKRTRRAGHPTIQATLSARAGDANIASTSLLLPKTELIDQAHIKTICTRVQLAAGNCPKAAIYGYASAESPLLEKELAGPVYLVSSNHTLPDLLADLQGQVDIHLHGAIDQVHGRIRTTFAPVPDVPVSKFQLTMYGGNKGILVNSKNLCAKRRFSRLEFDAQNGKQLIDKRLPLTVAGCKAPKKKSKKHHHKAKAKGKKSKAKRNNKQSR